MSDKDVTKEEKLGIIASHIRNIKVNKFNLELTILEEEASTSPNEADILSINSQITILNSKISALEEKYTAVQAE